MDSTGDKLRQDLDKIGIAVDNLNHTLENMSAVTRQGEATARAPSGACSTTRPSPTTSSRSPRTRAASSARSRGCRRIIGLRSRVQRHRQHAQDLRLGAADVAARQVLPHRAHRRSARLPHRHDDLHDHRRSVQAADDGVEHHHHHRSLPLQLPAGQAHLPAQRAHRARPAASASRSRPAASAATSRFRWRWRRRGCARSASISTSSTSAPTSIRASRSWRRSSSTSTSGSSAASTTCFNGRGPGAGVSTGRDYFFGAQLTFNDDDIRALLTIGGAALLGSAGR